MLIDFVTKNQLFKALAAERQMTSLIDKDFIANGESFTFYRSDWVPLYYDRGNAVTSDDGSQTAYRAITTRGDLLWLVFSAGKTRGYHAEDACPFDACHTARCALNRRRAIKQNDWQEVRQLARALRQRRIKMDVRIADAEASPLCEMGTRYFLRRIGRPSVKRMSGFTLAWLMLLDGQLGFVLHQAAQRQGITVKTQDNLAGVQPTGMF